MNGTQRRLLLRRIGKAGKAVWEVLPPDVHKSRFGRVVGSYIHVLSRKFSPRRQSNSTRFFRYPPLLLTIGDLFRDWKGDSVRLCVVGCSTGEEMYSILFAIRNARRNLNVAPTGIDISKPAIDKAKKGVYCRQDVNLDLTPFADVQTTLFDINDAEYKIKDCVGAGVEWVAADVRDDRLRSKLCGQDIVLANNFLIHMKEADAVECLREVVQLVRPGGFLICRGVDLDVRERVTRELKLEPIQSRIEEIHHSGVPALQSWPWSYAGLEPLDKTRKDWVRRYAAVFRVP